MELETLGAAWELAGGVVVLALTINALRVYTAMAHRQLKTVAENSDDNFSAESGEVKNGRKLSAKQNKKVSNRPKLEFIRK